VSLLWESSVNYCDPQSDFLGRSLRVYDTVEQVKLQLLQPKLIRCSLIVVLNL
jgi:hypothetical protein